MDGDDAWQKLGAAARYSKIFAENNECVVILLCQVNSDGVIRYAKSISEHSSNSWIWTPSSEDMEGATSITLDVRQMKGRNQQRFPFKIGLDLELMRLKDVEDPYSFKGEKQEKQQERGGRSSGKVKDQTSRVTVSEDGPEIDEDYVESLKD